jgi:hypothetical protein
MKREYLVLTILILVCFAGARLRAHDGNDDGHLSPQEMRQMELMRQKLEREDAQKGAAAHIHDSNSVQDESVPHTHDEAAPHVHNHDDMSGMNMEHDAGGGMEHRNDDMDAMGTMDGMQHEHPAGEKSDHDHAAHSHSAAPPSATLVRGLLVATFVIAGAMLFFTRRSLKRAAPAVGSGSIDLLTMPYIGAFLRSRSFLRLLIWPTLAVFSIIIVAGLWGEQSTGNPSVLLTWILWWPAVVFTFFLIGRIWCAMCPFGFLGDFAQKIFSFKWKPPAFLKNMWWRVGFFLLLTGVTSIWALDRWPVGTAWLALAETIGAILLAIFFEKRVFCRYVCPVGGIFGLYSMTAPVRLHGKDPKVCIEKCPGKNCVHSCTWFLYPPTVDRNAECNLCLNCVRACPHDNLALRTQPIGSDLVQFQPHRKSLDEATAIAVVLGVALFQTASMLGVWSSFQEKVGDLLHISEGRLLFTVLYLLVGVIVPLAAVGLVAYLTVPSPKTRSSFLAALRTYSYALIPLALGLHAAHNFHHLFGEGGAMWIGLKKTAVAYAANVGWTLKLSISETPWSPSPNALYIMQFVALLAGFYLAARVSAGLVRRSKVPVERAFRTVMPMFLFALAYTVMNLFVLSSAMSHRH